MAPATSSSSTPSDQVSRRASILARHLQNARNSNQLPSLESSICLQYFPAEISTKSDFETRDLRRLMDGHNLEDRDWLFGLMLQSNLFCPRSRGGKVFVSADYNQTMEQQREMTMKRIGYLLSRGVFEGWLTKRDPESELRKLAFLECVGSYDHSLAIKIGVHFFLW